MYVVKKLSKVFAIFISLGIFCSFAGQAKKVTPNLSFYGIKKTLQKIKDVINRKQKGAYVCLDSEEFYVVYNSSKKIKKELNEFLSLKESSIIKALPLHNLKLGTWEYGIWPSKSDEICLDILKKANSWWSEDISDIYSSAALSTTLMHDSVAFVMFLKFLRNNNCCLFIGSPKVPRDLIKLIFGEACMFVSDESFVGSDEIDELERVCLDRIASDDSYKIVITSSGITGKILQKRLWEKSNDIFLFDFGSIVEILCGIKKYRYPFDFNVAEFVKRFKKEVRVVCSAAILNKDFNRRKDDYIRSLETISRLGYEPYVVEPCINGPSFLDEYSKYVFYSKTNDLRLKNKGINEARSLHEALKYFNFDDEDMIVKITGRYCFVDDFFLKLVEYNIDADAIVRPWIAPRSIFTGCFALKAKHFKEILQKIDQDLAGKMERRCISVELIMGDYIDELKKKGKKVIFVDEVHQQAYHFGSGGLYYDNKIVKYW